MARIGNRFRDQLAQTGHDTRLGDLERVGQLGVRTLRYPVLFESVSPLHPEHCDWSWTDERLAALRRLSIRPIVGLLHHGSGPRYTSLLDPGLPDLLAGHAGRVAARYPWIDSYTPVNEPLTTARFSALYGHWYPHATDMRSFAQAVVIQCKAVVLAMRAIRRINPHTQLVQTEDIGKTFSTPDLAVQAEHENLRRWLSLDLLCGRVDRHHPWHHILRQQGISDRDLDLFGDGDAVPDIIGVNHYLTSERFLDQAVADYPGHLQGSNGRQTFADAEAVRVALPPQELGPMARLTEVWERYRLPIAVSEVHHGCTRDEQLRWLAEVWRAAVALRQGGADIRAVTAWALFGTCDWNSLLTEDQEFYEPGAFDVRAPEPRLTAIGKAVSSLVTTAGFDHPVLDTPGWWHRADRYYRHAVRQDAARPSGRTLVLVGASRPLTAAFARICHRRGLHHTIIEPRHDGPTRLAEVLRQHRAWAVVDTWCDASEAVQDPAASDLARACAELDLPWVGFSSDKVFDGRLGRPYVETDPVCPADPEGRRLARRERDLMDAHRRALLVRTGPLFSVWDENNFGIRMFDALQRGAYPPWGSTIVSPTYVPDLAHAVLDLLIDGETGIWHLVNRGQIGLSDLARRLMGGTVNGPSFVPSTSDPIRNIALASQRGWPMPPLDAALSRFVADVASSRAVGVRLAAE